MGAKAQSTNDYATDDASIELQAIATDPADIPKASNANFRPKVNVSSPNSSTLTRLYHGISTRLQFMALFLSLVGIGFGVKSYLHVRDDFGVEASAGFLTDLYVQIGIAVAINIIAGILIAASVSKPLLRLGETMRKLTENKLDVEVPYVSVPNEIGSMARKVQVFKDNAVQMRRMEAEQEQAREKNEADRKKLLNDLAAEFDSTVRAIVNQVTESATHMQSTSQSMKSSTEDSNERITELTKEMARTTENVNSVAAAGEELTASIKEIATQVNRSTNIIQEAVDKSKVANENINALSDGAQKIEEIIGIINDIAEQINLLALNATIEAARAGEAGKGFAVVASEVKNLASQTAKATEQISSFIQDIQGKTGATVTSIESINKTIEEMTAISDTISEAVREQDNATREIAGHIQEAANNTNEVSTNVSKVHTTSTHIGDEAGNLLDATNGLTQNSAHLNDEVARFIERLKSA